MKNILITGSNGYIGSYLVPKLKKKRGYCIFEAIRENGCNLAQDNWVKNIPRRNFDVIIHLAQSKQYRHFPQGAVDIFNVNVRATFELLEWGRLHGVKRFIFSSTGNVYPLQKRKVVETNPCIPGSMYAVSKLCAEHLIRQYSSFFEACILRIFSVYGPGQQDNLISNIIDRVKKNKSIVLTGNKGIVLTPLFISDCVGAIEKFICAHLINREFICNLAGDELISLAEIVSHITSMLQCKSQIRITNQRSLWLCADNTLMRKFYKPKTRINPGLRRAIYGK